MKKSLLFYCCFIFLIFLCSCEQSTNNTDNKTDNQFEVIAEQTNTSIAEITSDNIAEKLQEFGMTEEEAKKGREILLTCGVASIDGCKPTNSNSTIDGLIAFLWKIDNDRTVWFTVENREIFYVALNGEDLYNKDNGGFLKNFSDVHIPETAIENEVKINLKNLTEQTLDKYFKNAKYYDGWGIGRADNDYMVQCEVYATNDLKIKDWIPAKVWYTELDDGSFNVIGVQINGVQYELQ